MSAPTPEQLTETITHAINIAPQLAEDAEWIYIDAYWPPGRNPDRPTRVHPRTDRTHPDHVPGARLDLGIGNDQARAAWQRSATLVAAAHRHAGIACAHYSGRRPPLGQRTLRPDDYPTVAANTVRRLRRLLGWDVTTGPDSVRRTTQAAAVALIEAHAALRAVMADIDGTGEPDGSRRCTNCGDPCSPGRGRRECEKCARYRQRTGRARTIRRHADAYASRDRRAERGETAAEAPLPRGRYIDGVWVASQGAT